MLHRLLPTSLPRLTMRPPVWAAVVALGACGLLTACPTAPPDVPAPEMTPEPSETIINPFPEASPELEGCGALADTARVSRNAEEEWEISQAGPMRRGPGGLTHTQGIYGNSVVNVSTGTHWVSGWYPQEIPNPTWTAQMSVGGEGDIEIRTLPQGEVTTVIAAPQVPASEDPYVATLNWSGDGSHVASLWCWTDASQTPLVTGSVLLVNDAATGDVVWRTDLAQCPWTFSSVLPLLLDVTGETGVLSGIPAGGMTLFDRVRDTVDAVQILDLDSIDPEDFNPGREVLDGALTKDGKRVLVSGVLDTVSLFDVETQALLWSQPAGRFAVNNMTYQPSVNVPVTISSDGRFGVFPAPVAPDAVHATLNIVNLEDGTLVRALEIPMRLDEPAPGGTQAGAPMTLIFDHQGLTVGLEGGSAHWDCAEKVPAPSESLDIAVEAPATVSRENGAFTINVETTLPRAAIRDVLPTAGVYAVGTLTEQLRVTFDFSVLEASSATFTVVVDNGFEVAMKDVTIAIVD